MTRKFTAQWAVSVTNLHCRFCHEPIKGAVFLNGQPGFEKTVSIHNPDAVAHLRCLLMFQKGLRAAFGGEEA